MKEIKITLFLKKALQVLHDNDNISARGFASNMWPDSPGWNKCSNCGQNGARYGAGMFLCAGSYLAKLRYKGLVVRRGPYLNRYSLTAKGENLLMSISKGEEIG